MEIDISIKNATPQELQSFIQDLQKKFNSTVRNQEISEANKHQPKPQEKKKRLYNKWSTDEISTINFAIDEGNALRLYRDKFPESTRSEGSIVGYYKFLRKKALVKKNPAEKKPPSEAAAADPKVSIGRGVKVKLIGGNGKTLDSGTVSRQSLLDGEEQFLVNFNSGKTGWVPKRLLVAA